MILATIDEFYYLNWFSH